MKIRSAMTSEPVRASRPATGTLRIGRACLALLLLLAGVSSCGKKEPGKPVDYSTSNEVSITFGRVTRTYGVRQAKVDHDGTTTPAQIGGLNCHLGKAGAWNAGYIYFIVDPTFKRTNCQHVRVTVQYFDSVPGYFNLQYDGQDPSAPGSGSYAASPKRVKLSGAREWGLEDFVLRDVRFQNSQNGNADFRLHFKTKEFHVCSVTVTRLPRARSPLQP